ncbi:MAG TPA: transposase [Isosphaeraceae bacterium]|nr:transposase [Isosphaeraceae bacterium]
MSARPMIRDWRKQVRHQLLPELHGHQANALADLSFAMAVARHCHSGKLAAVAPGDTTPAATQRRLERTLANDRLDPEAAWPQLARAILEGHAGGPIILILDETPNHNDLRCLKITLAYRQRALPIRSVCYAPGGQPEPMPELIGRLFREVAAGLPERACVTLLADRGLAWPQVVDACTELGWHYVIRLQGQTKVRTADGDECTAAALAPRPRASWCGEAEVFKKSGWRKAAVAACWPPGSDVPWLLVSDRNDGPRLFGRYAKRTWTEELFKDEKSSGFHWEQSHVTDPAHAGRLVLLIALATYLALGLGSRVIRAGLRRLLESGRERMLSLFQIGLRFLIFCLTHDRPLPEDLSPVPS